MKAIATIVAAALGMAIPAAAAPASGVVTRWNVGAWTVWRVDRPAAGDYAEIHFLAGDRVLVDAGGCGLAAEVAIPGATAGAVAVRAILRREQRVDAPVPDPAPLAVFAGCEGRQDGWLMIGARHAADDPLPLPRPMDLVSNGSVDANGVALNPQWGLQQTQPGTLPDPIELCIDVPGWFDNPICTVQRPSLDRPAGVKDLICRIGTTTPINGHVNWFPATYQGPLFWHGKFFSDQDINISLVPPERRGLTVADDVILTEFSSRETLGHFATPWWKDLRRAADLFALERGRELVDGRPGVVTGLVGLDCEHDCHPELHPVWMLAIRAEAEAARERWALFARNWGNEGFCSSQQHLLETVGHRLTVTVPWREGATGVRLGRRTRFYANVDGVLGWWTSLPGQYVSVTFQLPPPDARGRVHGELDLAWSGPAAPPDAAVSVPRPARERGDGPEPLVEDLVASLTPQQRRELGRREPRAAEDRIPVVLQPGPPPSAGVRPFAPSVRAVADPGRDAEDLRRLKTLLEVHEGLLPAGLRDLPSLLEPR